MSKFHARAVRALLVLLAPLLTAPGLAQGLADEPARVVETEHAQRERECRRVLRLADGAVLRAKSRWMEGDWEVLRGRAWEPLGGAQVVSWREERTLLAEAERRAGALGPRDEGARLHHAGWLREVGLLPESLDVLDGFLRADPDHRRALESLARHPRLAELPSRDAIRADPGNTLKELLALASRVGPARQELVLRELDEVFGGPNLERVLEHALRSGSDRRRAFATLALRRILLGGALPELLRRAVLDPHEDVRRGAAFALRDVGEEALVLPLVRALESSNAFVRAHAAESLGHMGFAAAAPALRAHLARLTGAAAQGSGAGHHGQSGSLRVTSELAYVRDFDVEIAQAASIADPRIAATGEGTILDVRLGGISTLPAGRELRSVRRALVACEAAERRAEPPSDPGPAPDSSQR